MSAYQYKQYQQRKENLKKAKEQNAIHRFKGVVVRILMQEEMKNVTNIEVESIIQDEEETEVVFRCKVNFQQKYFRVMLKMKTRRYKIIEIEKDEADIQRGYFFVY